MSKQLDKQEKVLFVEISKLIADSRQKVALVVNAEITLLYWHIGFRIRQEILQNTRAEYGKQIIEKLSRQLTEEYGNGWSKRHLHHCLRIAEIFPTEEIVHALRTQLSWTHIRLLAAIEDKLRRKLHQAIENARARMLNPKNYVDE